ncbi:DUF433 domain-containing protein [Thiohalocapsa sp. ML1]|uniref:DUF433 domain-containing protein n=1 Tax=Thiohalocapsa sp. ML1 TaxID=1431688 RepID=UPI0020B11802|nr:DUF433 domain-containing protein [Thiohalocapsa sp. ML1]
MGGDGLRGAAGTNAAHPLAAAQGVAGWLTPRSGASSQGSTGEWGLVAENQLALDCQLRIRRIFRSVASTGGSDWRQGNPMIQDELLQRITARPDVFGGKPIIRDLRISVEMILSLLAQGESPAAILGDYPGLEPADINACLAYAHAVIAHDRIDRIALSG